MCGQGRHAVEGPAKCRRRSSSSEMTAVGARSTGEDGVRHRPLDSRRIFEGDGLGLLLLSLSPKSEEEED